MPLPPETAECLAILRRLPHCLPLGITNLTIKSDCQVVVQELLQEGASLSFLGNVLLDIDGAFGELLQERASLF